MPCTSQGLLCSPNILTCSETNTGWCAITATPSPGWPSGCCTAPPPSTTSSPAPARRSRTPTPMLPTTTCPSEPSRSIRSAPPSAPSIEFPELGAIDPREHAHGAPSDVVTGPTPSPGKLLKRSEAARLLGVSTATVRRMEGTTLSPVLGPDGVHRFLEEHVRELVIHRVRMVPESPDAYDAEEAATAFDLFDQDVHQVDVVKRTRLHPRAVAAMYREWASMRGGYAVTGEIARQLAALPWLLGSRPICRGEDLLKCLRQTAPHACSRCQQPSPQLRAQCAKDLTLDEA